MRSWTVVTRYGGGLAEVLAGDDIAGDRACRQQLYLDGPLRRGDRCSIWTRSWRPFGFLGGSASSDLQTDNASRLRAHASVAGTEGRMCANPAEVEAQVRFALSQMPTQNRASQRLSSYAAT